MEEFDPEAADDMLFMMMYSLIDDRRGIICLVKDTIRQRQFQRLLNCIRPDNDAVILRFALKEMCVLVRRNHPLELGAEYRKAMVSLMSPQFVQNTIFFRVAFTTVVKVYFPTYVNEFLDIFMCAEGVSDKSEFMRNTFAALEDRLYFHLMEKQIGPKSVILRKRQAFGKLLFSCRKALHYDPVPVPVSDSPDIEDVLPDHYPLFSTAVHFNLLEESVLLYDTGAVNNSELAGLAQKDHIQRMLEDDDDDNLMATFLRSTLKQPRSLRSAAVIEVFKLVRYYAPGGKDRLNCLNLPQSVSKNMLLGPFKQFKRSLRDSS